MDEIKLQLKLLIKAALAEFNLSNEDDSIYAVFFALPPEGNFVYCLIMSDKQLFKNVEWYLNNGYKVLSDRPTETVTKSLRWHTGEDWFTLSSEPLNASILDAIKQGAIELFDKKTEKLCIESLLELDQEGCFVFNNRKAVLGLTYTAETSEEFMSWIEQLNSQEIIQEVAVQNDEMYEAGNLLVRAD